MEKGRTRSTAESRSWPAGAGSSTAKCENKKMKIEKCKMQPKEGKTLTKYKEGKNEI